MGMMSSVSVIFDTRATYSCSCNKGDFLKLEENIFPIKIKGIAKGLHISGFGIVKYSGRMISLWAQEYYFPGLPKDFHIISPQGICTSEGYKGNFIDHFHNEHGSYAKLNLKKDKPCWQKAEPVERVYVKYDPKNNLPNHEAILPNQRYKEVKALASSVCVINKAK